MARWWARAKALARKALWTRAWARRRGAAGKDNKADPQTGLIGGSCMLPLLLVAEDLVELGISLRLLVDLLHLFLALLPDLILQLLEHLV